MNVSRGFFSIKFITFLLIFAKKENSNKISSAFFRGLKLQRLLCPIISNKINSQIQLLNSLSVVGTRTSALNNLMIFALLKISDKKFI